MASDLTYVATLDDSQVLKALQNIDRNIDKLSGQADKNFQSIGKSASSSGLQIGAMAGVVTSLVTEFINLGKQAIDVLISIGQQSVQTALEIDTLKARLGGIFDGNKEAADQAFTFIQQKSKELGIDLGELAGAFIPKTESLAQFERVAKIATALARSDPEQGAIGARIALIEALSGTFTSLQRRFEIPKQDIDALKEAFDTGGMEAFLAKFEEVLAASGKSFDDLGNTAQATFNKAAIAGQQFLGQLGTPIVEELKKQFDDLNSTLAENETDYALIADAVGRVVANIVDLIGTGINDIFANLDTEQVIEIAEGFFDIVENVRALADVLTTVDFASSFVDNLQFGVDKLNEALETAIKISALARAEEARQAAQKETFAKQVASEQGGEGFLSGAARIPLIGEAAAGLTTSIGEQEKATEILKAGEDAYRKSLEDSLKVMEESTKRKGENKTATDSLRDSLEKAKDAGTGEADAIQAAAAAQRKAAEDAETLKEAQTKVNEEMAKAQKDFDRKLEDIDIATERKRLDIAIEFAQKREDAAKNNLQKLADLRKKNGQDISDAAKDLNRKEEDIARKFSQERLDLEQDNRQKRVDIEKSFRETLQAIQDQFLTDAEESERKRDAVGFLRAVRERDKKVKEAQDNRSKEITETQTTGELKRQELALQQQRELEEARIANERKLEDLKTNLSRQIEEQNTAYARQLDDLMTAEVRKNEELNRSREQDIADAKLAYDRKLEDLKVSLAAELALIEEFAAKKAAALASIPKSTTYNPKYSSPEFKVPAGTSHGPGGRAAVAKPTKSIYGFASGGTVPGPRGAPMLAMVHGGERIIPNSPVIMPAMTPGGASYNVTNNNQKQASLGGLLDASNLDAMLATKVQNILLNLLGNL